MAAFILNVLGGKYLLQIGMNQWAWKVKVHLSTSDNIHINRLQKKEIHHKYHIKLMDRKNLILIFLNNKDMMYVNKLQKNNKSKYNRCYTNFGIQYI